MAVAVVITLTSSVYALKTIKLNANLDELVSEKLDYHKRYIEFLKEFGDEEYLYIVVDASKNLKEAKGFVDAVNEGLKKVPNLKQVISKIDNPALEKNFLFYLNPEELSALKTMTSSGPFGVGNLEKWTDFAPLFGALATRVSGEVSPKDEKELATGFTFIDGLLEDMMTSLETGTEYKSRLQSLFFGNTDTFDTDGYLKNGSLLFMLIMPSKDFSTMDVIGKPLEDIRVVLADVKKQFPNIDAGLTGRPVLSADEMKTANDDNLRATAIAITIQLLLLILFFKNGSRPLFAIISLVMGISWTFGLVAILYGTLNLLSMVFAIILASTAVEYGIQIVARYQEELSESGRVSSAIETSLSLTGKAVLTSALTTAAAFCAILWTDFSALVQLGVIAASGVILCLIAMLTVLPAMIVLRDRRRPVRELKKVHPFLLPHLERIFTQSRLVLGISAVVTIVFIIFVPRTGFDNNLLNLQAKGLESVKYENLIIEKSSETTWFARATADSIESSHEKVKLFSALPSVRKVDDVERILPEDQKSKMAFVKQMSPVFSNLNFHDANDKVNKGMLMFELGRLSVALDRLQTQAFSSGRIDAVNELETFSGKTKNLVSLLDKASDSQLMSLGNFQRDFFKDLQKNLSILATGMKPNSLTLKDLPEDMVGRFVSPKGRFGLFIYPKENIWDPVALQKFVSDIRSVDPEVVGTPIEVYESGNLMRDTFLRSAILAFAVICFLVWLDFRSLRCVFLTVFSLVLGTLWLLGVMGMSKIPFNMANFFAIPILIGYGVDFGVNVMHRLRQERSYSAIGSSMAKGLLLTALASAAGFGTMMFAHHQGIASLGKIMVLGCLFCFVVSVIVLPPIAKWLNWGDKEKSNAS